MGVFAPEVLQFPVVKADAADEAAVAGAESGGSAIPAVAGAVAYRMYYAGVYSTAAGDDAADGGGGGGGGDADDGGGGGGGDADDDGGGGGDADDDGGPAAPVPPAPNRVAIFTALSADGINFALDSTPVLLPGAEAGVQKPRFLDHDEDIAWAKTSEMTVFQCSDGSFKMLFEACDGQAEGERGAWTIGAATRSATNLY